MTLGPGHASVPEAGRRRPSEPESQSRVMTVVLSITRTWLPASIAAVGVVFTVLGHGRSNIAAVGVCLLLVALTVWLINWLFRMSIESNHEREDEEEARRFFDRTGRWPDDATGG